MDVERLRLGEKIAAGAAVLLFISMFLDWFGVKVSGASREVEEAAESAGGGANAWDALNFIPFFILLAIFVVLAMAFLRASDTKVSLPVSLSVAVTALSAFALLLILYRVISPPVYFSFFGVEVGATRKLGLFLGLITAVAMTYGSWRTMEDEGTSFGDRADRIGAGTGSDADGPGPGAGPAPGTGTSSGPPPPPPPSSGGPSPPSV